MESSDLLLFQSGDDIDPILFDHCVFFNTSRRDASNTCTRPLERFLFSSVRVMGGNSTTPSNQDKMDLRTNERWCFIDAYSHYIHLSYPKEKVEDFFFRVFAGGDIPKYIQLQRSYKKALQKASDWLYKFRVVCIVYNGSYEDDYVRYVENELAELQTFEPMLQCRFNCEPGPGQVEPRHKLYCNYFRVNGVSWDDFKR